MKTEYLKLRLYSLINNISINESVTFDLESPIFNNINDYLKYIKEKDDIFLNNLKEEDLDNLKKIIKKNKYNHIHNVNENDKQNFKIYQQLVNEYIKSDNNKIPFVGEDKHFVSIINFKFINRIVIQWT